MRRTYPSIICDGTLERRVLAVGQSHLGRVPRRGEIPDRVSARGIRHQPEVRRVVVDRLAADGHAHHYHGERWPGAITESWWPGAFQRRLADIVCLLSARYLIGQVALER